MARDCEGVANGELPASALGVLGCQCGVASVGTGSPGRAA